MGEVNFDYKISCNPTTLLNIFLLEVNFDKFITELQNLLILSILAKFIEDQRLRRYSNPQLPLLWGRLVDGISEHGSHSQRNLLVKESGIPLGQPDWHPWLGKAYLSKASWILRRIWPREALCTSTTTAHLVTSTLWLDQDKLGCSHLRKLHYPCSYSSWSQRRCPQNVF